LRGKRNWPKPQAVRETFQDLGLVFIKFGQVLALRRDLLPDEYIAELELLHDELPGLAIDVVRATIETELGAPMSALFSTFSESPLAAATIAQVHEATTGDGRHVAVKVQRPGLDKVITTDMVALNYLVVLAEKFFPNLRAFELPLAAKAAAATRRFDAVVCLGCLVRGETPHFDYISSAVSHGLADASLQTGVPVAFGVLTVDTLAQAEARALPDRTNKGFEAAAAAVEMVHLLRRVAVAATPPLRA